MRTVLMASESKVAYKLGSKKLYIMSFDFERASRFNNIYDSHHDLQESTGIVIVKGGEYEKKNS